MSKRAEEAASAAYPFVKMKFVNSYGVTEFDGNYDKREVFREGYEQAEKDTIELAQLWVDSGDANIMSFKQFLKCHETQSNK